MQRGTRKDCKAICRGLFKEQRKREMKVTAVAEVRDPIGRRLPDPEEHHDREEAELSRGVVYGLTQYGPGGE